MSSKSFGIYVLGRFRMSKSCGCCMKWKEHYYRNHMHDEKQHFFTSMTGDFKRRMIIPEKFVRSQISGTVQLEGPNGNIYKVGVIEHMASLVLQSGWEAFVNAHHIEKNDSLLFRYSGNSRFRVLIFDSSGCEKVSSFVLMKNALGFQESSGESIEISSSSRDHTMPSLPSERSARQRRGSSSHCRKAVKMTSTSSPSEKSGEDLVSSENGPLESDDLRMSAGSGYVLSNRCYLTRAQEEKVAAFVQKIQPEIPILVALMNKTNVKPDGCVLVIRKDYAVAHLPHASQIVTLQQLGRSKKWHARFNIKPDGGRTLYGGWTDFVRDNHVQEGDICLFELMKSNKRLTITVHLLRTGSSHSPAGLHGAGSSHGGKSSKTTLTRPLKEEPAYSDDVHDRHVVTQEALEYGDVKAPVPSYILPERSYLTRLQEKKAKEKIQAIRSAVPIYVAILNKSNVGICRPCLVFSKRFSTAYLPDKEQEMTLQRLGKSKKWHAKFCIGRNDARALSGGWSVFVRENHLQRGDICLFELMKNADKLTMTVYLIRKEKP